MTAWQRAVRQIRESPALREEILQSVMSSMAFDGIEVDRTESERVFDEALDGPELVLPEEE